MNQQKKPTPKKPEAEDDDSQDITIGSKDLHVKLSLNGRGIVLIYALAFAIVVGTIGWVAFQLITALKITAGATTPAIGFIIWSLTALGFALVSR